MSTPDVTPERIFQIVNAFQSSRALKGALDLGLFTALGGGSATAAVLAERISASEKGTRVLCDFLVIAGLLEKEGSEYRSSPDAAVFLDENSPAYFGTVGQFMLDDGLVSCFADVAALARKGGTLLDGQGTVEPDNPLWVDFARSMVPLMMPSAEFIAGLITQDYPENEPLRVLDIAAGHGLFGINIASQASGCRDRGARLARGAGRGRRERRSVRGDGAVHSHAGQRVRPSVRRGVRRGAADELPAPLRPDDLR